MEVLSKILGQQGYQVRSFTDASEALRHVRSEDPALILLSPKLRGTEAFKRLWEFAQPGLDRIPLLFITERTDVATQRACLEPGVSDIVCKPFRANEVVARVRVFFQLGSLRKRLRGVSRRNAAVREQDRWIRSAMEARKVCAFEWNPATDGVHRSHLEVHDEETGNSHSRKTGWNWFRRILPDDLPRFLRILTLLSPAFNQYDTRYRVFDQDGSVVHVHESARAWFDVNRKLIRLAGTITDITEQEQTMDVLRQVVGETVAIVKDVPLPAVIADAKGNTQYVNHRFVEAFGYQLEEVAHLDTWLKRALRGPAHETQALPMGREDAASETHKPATAFVPRRITCHNGTTRFVEVLTSRVGNQRLVFFNDVADGGVGNVASLSDSEERFRSLADTAPVMVWVSGPDMLCTFFNKAWLRYTGRTMQQELGNGWAEGVHPDDLDRCFKIYTTAFEARAEFSMEYRLRRHNGEYGWILDRGVPRFTSPGVFAGYIGSCTDVSEVKQHQQHSAAAQSLEDLGVLAAVIAHDLSNLLGSILGWADVSRFELNSTSPARDGILKIEKLALCASDIVRQIQTYAGGDQTKRELVNLSFLVEDMLELLRISIPKGSHLHLKLPSDLPEVLGNPSQLRQAVMNLVLNAAQALKEQPGTISIRLHTKHLSRIRQVQNSVLPEGDYLCLEVSDTGTGMEEEVKAHIFQPFFTTKVTGRGLGLAVVQRVVQSHEGGVLVVSVPGKGTRFQILLPTASAERTEDASTCTVRTASAGC